MGSPQKQVRLSARDVSAAYINRANRSATVALKSLNLDVYEGEFLCIVGPSGCGKSTFLRTVIGLQRVSAGQLTLNGRPIEGPGPERAQVFQSANLLPWRTVMGNVLYGMELRGVPRTEARQRAMEHIRLVGLAGFENYYPHALSGGMQQRVNLARALASKPELLLLDEPFAALDAQTREFMQLELLNIWQTHRKTAIFITHQINEAIYLGDRVIVLSARPGRVKAMIDVPFPRPRPLNLKRSLEFLRIEDHIWSLIQEEFPAAK